MKFKLPNKKNNPTFYYGFIVVIAVFIIGSLLTNFGEGSQEEGDDWYYPASEYASYYASLELAEESSGIDSTIYSQTTEAVSTSASTEETKATVYKEYTFRYDNLLQSHYEKHGIEMGFDSPEEYLAAANAVVNNPNALHKYEKEDGDDVYYVEDTREFVVVSTDGYIRTYYYASKAYFDRQ